MNCINSYALKGESSSIKQKGETKMNDNVVEFPKQETKTTEVKTPEKGVTTINELRKKVKEIDIYSITPDGSEGEYGNTCFYRDRETGKLSIHERMFNPYFNKKTDKMEYRLALRKDSTNGYNLRWHYPKGVSSGDYDSIRFSGKNYGSGTQQDFTNCVIYTDRLRGTIRYVQYDLDNNNNQFFMNFLRSTIDPSIENNWDEIHKTKTFELIVETTTYEKISAEGRNIEEARVNAEKSDETLEWMSGRFNGKRKIMDFDASRFVNFQTREEILAERTVGDA
jgi:hypothetical protein